MAGTLQIIANYVDNAGNQQGSPPVVNIATPNGSKTVTVLASGANTITVPQLPVPTFCIIIPNPSNTVAMTVKGIAGDTGIRISQIYPTMLSFDPAALPASFVVNAASLATTSTTFIFI